MAAILPSLPALGMASAALAILLAADLRWRRIPWTIAGGLLLAGILTGWAGAPWSWTGMVLGGALVLVAGFPGGDVRAGVIMGGFLGPLPVALVLGAAYGLTILAWHLEGDRLRPWMFFLAMAFVSVVVILGMLSLVTNRQGQR